MFHAQVSPHFFPSETRNFFIVPTLLCKELRKLVKISLAKRCEFLRSSDNLLFVDENADLPLFPYVLFILTPDKAWLLSFEYKAIQSCVSTPLSSYVCLSQRKPLTYPSTVGAFSLQWFHSISFFCLKSPFPSLPKLFVQVLPII